tara:strand:+ start:63381 stop:63710 length:330 start_codon:yes stop_codon:yes gene_type:complete
MIAVTSVNDLKEAVSNLEDEIVVEGKVAKYLYTLKNLAPAAVFTLGVGIFFPPVAYFASVSTGAKNAGLLIAISSIGITLIFAILKNYDFIGAEFGPFKINLRRKNTAG